MVKTPIDIHPDLCSTVLQLKQHLASNSFELWGLRFHFYGAILYLQDRPDIEEHGETALGIEQQQLYDKWRERNMVYGRQAWLRIKIVLDPSEST
jgi:hypothetical protein